MDGKFALVKRHRGKKSFPVEVQNNSLWRNVTKAEQEEKRHPELRMLIRPKKLSGGGAHRPMRNNEELCGEATS